MDNFKVATHSDLPTIFSLLTSENAKQVMVRSLFRCEDFPLLSVCEGPFTLTEEGIVGFDFRHSPITMRIIDCDSCSVELRKEGGSWFSPELGGIILLIPVT